MKIFRSVLTQILKSLQSAWNWYLFDFGIEISNNDTNIVLKQILKNDKTSLLSAFDKRVIKYWKLKFVTFSPLFLGLNSLSQSK